MRYGLQSNDLNQMTCDPRPEITITNDDSRIIIQIELRNADRESSFLIVTSGRGVKIENHSIREMTHEPAPKFLSESKAMI